VNESKAEVLDVSGLLSAAVTARSSESVEAGVSALVKVSTGEKVRWHAVTWTHKLYIHDT
jgi:hypothetical protein